MEKNKKYFTDRFSELQKSYNSDGWDSVHRDKTEYLYPHGRNLTDQKKGSDGTRKDGSILNNVALIAIRIATAGMFMGITPPNEKWLKLASQNKELNNLDHVTYFFEKSTDRMLEDLGQSNFYTIAELIFKDCLTYNISNVFIDEDFDSVFHFSHIPNGQYYIDVDSRGEVSCTYRLFKMRARNIISEFGINNVSSHIRDMVSHGKTGGQLVVLLHAVERNESRDITRSDNRNMPWMSVIYEHENSTASSPLRSSGYLERPFVVPRWSVSSGNIYGNGPGDEVLGDDKMLQGLMQDLVSIIELSYDGPKIGPAGIRADFNPGSYIAVDEALLRTGKPAIQSLDNSTDISKITALILDTSERIKTAMFSELFYSLSAVNSKTQTATEVIARQNELLRLLGPVIQRMVPELILPVVKRCFNIEYRLGRLPEIPEELSGQPIKIELQSRLARAQELGSVSPINEMASIVGNMAQIWPEATMKFDVHKAIDELERSLGVPTGIIRPDDVVKDIMAIQAAREQQQYELAQTSQAINDAKALSETKVEGNNALGAALSGGGIEV